MEANELEGENSAQHGNVIPTENDGELPTVSSAAIPRKCAGTKDRRGIDPHIRESLVTLTRDRENPQALKPKQFLELAAPVLEASDIGAAEKPTKKQLLSLLANTQTSLRR